MRCEQINLEKIEVIKNIEIIYNSKPIEIVGDGKVSGLKLGLVNGGEKLIEVGGVFIEIGSTPVTKIFEGLGVELEEGYIKVDKEGRTSVEGLFAAGDGTSNLFKQMITATAEGAVAAKTAYDFVKFGKK